MAKLRLDELTVAEVYQLFQEIYKKVAHLLDQVQMPGFEPIEVPILESLHNNPNIRFEISYDEDVHPKLLARFVKVILGKDEPVPNWYTLYLAQDGRLVIVTLKTRPVSALESAVGLAGELKVESLPLGKIETLQGPLAATSIDWRREIWAAAKALKKSFQESVDLEKKGGQLRRFD